MIAVALIAVSIPIIFLLTYILRALLILNDNIAEIYRLLKKKN